MLAPHADDESLGCGGLIASSRGRPPIIVCVTDGPGRIGHRRPIRQRVCARFVRPSCAPPPLFSAWRPSACVSSAFPMLVRRAKDRNLTIRRSASPPWCENMPSKPCSPLGCTTRIAITKRQHGWVRRLPPPPAHACSSIRSGVGCCPPDRRFRSRGSPACGSMSDQCKHANARRLRATFRNIRISSTTMCAGFASQPSCWPFATRILKPS